jgi:hypothetical protein
LKTLEKRNGKAIRKSREKEKGKAAQPAQLGPARPRARAPVSGGFCPARFPPHSLCLVGRTCNTPGIYIPLDYEYGFKHVISVDEMDAKF